MTIEIEPVTELALAVLISVIMGTFMLVLVAILRRRQEARYFQGVDQLRRNFGPILTKLLAGGLSPEGMKALRTLAIPDLELLLEPYLSKGKLRDHQITILQRLCRELGLIRIWQRRLAGEREPAGVFRSPWAPEALVHRVSWLHFLLRATSARNLGALRHEASWPLLAKSLDDLHPDVRSVALRSLALIHAPRSFSALLERLHLSVLEQDPSPSQDHLRAALAGFALPHSRELLSSLRHPHGQIRFLAADILREMVYRAAAGSQDFALTSEAISPDLSDLLLNQLSCDANPEVRSRIVEVIAYLHDARSAPVLLRLIDDAQWFVRLRTVRALAKRRYLPHLTEIRACLFDRQWRVREAAIQTLLSFSQEGTSHVFQHFLATDDRGCQDQIIEAIQRSGLVTSLVQDYAEGGNGLAKRVVEEIASLGATACIAGMLKSSTPEFRQRFLDRINPQLPPQTQILIPATLDSDLDFSKVAQFPPPLAA
jgi:HEAT repeat protein